MTRSSPMPFRSFRRPPASQRVNVQALRKNVGDVQRKAWPASPDFHQEDRSVHDQRDPARRRRAWRRPARPEPWPRAESSGTLHPPMRARSRRAVSAAAPPAPDDRENGYVPRTSFSPARASSAGRVAPSPMTTRWAEGIRATTWRQAANSVRWSSTAVRRATQPTIGPAGGRPCCNPSRRALAGCQCQEVSLQGAGLDVHRPRER